MNNNFPFPILLGLGAGILLAGFCVFCIAKPDKVAAYFRNKYVKSNRLLQKFPFANMVMKPWYPAYLRVTGVFGLGFVAIWLYVVLIRFSK